MENTLWFCIVMLGISHLSHFMSHKLADEPVQCVELRTQE